MTPEWNISDTVYGS